MKSFDKDFDWQRGLIPEIKRVLANYLITEAPADEDMKHNTDLIVLKLDTIRVACRVRRAIGENGINYLEEYPDEFTIRATRPNGQMTELPKMLSGWGDYIFYGFVDPDDHLAAWVLGDLKVFRLWHTQKLWRRQEPGKTKRNGDGSSTFKVYRISDLPADFVVARMQPRKAVA